MCRILRIAVLVVLLVLPLCARTENQAHSRSKRSFFFWNPDAPVLIGFITGIPISIALPTLVDTTPRALGEAAPDERLLDFEYPEDLFWEPAYDHELTRLESYFDTLKVPMVVCQERLVCELAAEPDAFSPFSTVVLRELSQGAGPVKPSQDSLFWRLIAASATGYAYSAEGCAEQYGACSRTARSILNMPVLKVWQFLSSLLNMKLT